MYHFENIFTNFQWTHVDVYLQGILWLDDDEKPIHSCLGCPQAFTTICIPTDLDTEDIIKIAVRHVSDERGQDQYHVGRVHHVTVAPSLVPHLVGDVKNFGHLWRGTPAMIEINKGKRPKEWGDWTYALDSAGQNAIVRV